MSSRVGKFEFAPQSALPPGETLKETIEHLGISQADLARRTGLSTKHLNQIAQGMAVLTPETALLLERATRIPAETWNNLEARWRSHQQRLQENEELAGQLSWLDNFSLGELVARRILPTKAKSVDNLRTLLTFLGVANPTAGRDVWDTYRVAFRRSTTKNADEFATAVWLRLCELRARQIPCERYDKEILLSLVPQMRALTLREPAHWFTDLPSLCAQAGVAVVFESAMRNTHLSGATRWLGPDKVMVALSDRFKRIDQFWFAFFHELGHVLHHGKRLTFLDENPTGGQGATTEEDEANKYAADVLIPPNLAEDYRALKARPKPFTRITSFAERAGIPPGIVVGRLQHERSIKWSEGNALVTSVDFAEHLASRPPILD
ncbi:MULTISPECIES: helix-turn-helix domain-containing protein [unclassified Nonomuraea]|uniref:helix-turn-helix domain-containing protein n=1 Tax=unclassified Nonomuraea TaxID=2593643 RepID=UPI0033FC5A31